MSIHFNITFELTEYDAGGENKVRNLRLEATGGRQLWTRLQIHGSSLSPAELSALSKMTDAMNELQAATQPPALT